MSRAFSTIFLLIFSSLLMSCGDRPLYIDDAVVRLSPVDGNPSAAYFNIHGGPEDVTLLTILSDATVKLELHETVEEDGVAMMKPVDNIRIPAGTEVKFEPGGKHVMLWGITIPARRLGYVPLTMLFSNGDRIVVDAKIEAIGTASEAK